jgi:Protein kinase domain
MTTIGAGRYQLGDEIARGAIGVVLRGTVTATGEPVAVKRLRPETAGHPESVVGFLGEAEILSQLAHPGIVRLRELLAESDGYALVLDLLEGADLRRRVRGGGPLAPALAVSVAAAVADALAYLHAQGYLHGDIKPGNIVLPDDGSPAQLVDFGVARRIGQGDRATYATPEYVAPEVVLGGAPTPAADVYALGMVLFELACGRSAYRGGASDEVMRRHLTCVPVPPPGLPEPLWPVISDCLSFDAARRPSATTVAATLRPLAGRLAALPASGPIPDDVVTWWPREAEDTAPVLGLQRVAWVPASRQSPEPAAPERLVAVPMPDRGRAAAPEPDGLLAGLGAAGAEPIRGGAAVPVWPGDQAPAASANRSKLPLLIGVGAAVLVLLALLALGGWLLRGQFGGGPVAGPSTSPSKSTPAPSASEPAPTGSTSSDSTPVPASPSDAGIPANDQASPEPGEPTSTPKTHPTAEPTPTLPSGLPSIGAPLPTFP